ncbi:MAG: MMPL family transporter [Euryarchaeota archaeon]
MTDVSLFERLANTIIKHPKAIVAFWVVALLISIPFAMQSNSVLNYDQTSMGGSKTESAAGMQLIYDSGYFFTNASSKMSTIVVVPFSNAAEEASIQQFQQSLATQLKGEYGNDATLSFAGRFSNDSVSKSGIHMYLITFSGDQKPNAEVPTIRSLVSNANTEGLKTYVTGQSAIGHDTESGAASDVSKIDPFTILLVLVLIGLFFRSIVASATPPIVIGFAYGILLCFVFFLGSVVDIYYITQIIVLVSMLGAGCDYCIFIVARYREERKNGLNEEFALRESVKWAGESITISGCAVIIGFGVMSFSSFSLISTMGIVLASGIVIALLAALTLIPSIIRLIGDRIFYPSTIETFSEDSKAMKRLYGTFSRFGQRYFATSAKQAIKYAWAIIIACALITIPLAYVATTSSSSFNMISTMPNGEAKQGVDVIVQNTNGGVIMPTYVVLEFNKSIATTSSMTLANTTIPLLIWNRSASGYLNLTDSLAKTIMTDERQNVGLAYGPTSWARLVSLYGNESTALQAVPSDLLKAAVSTVLASQLPAAYKVQSIDYILNFLGGSLGGPVNNSTGARTLNYAKITTVTKDEPLSQRSFDTIKGIQDIVDDFGITYSDVVTNCWVTGSAVSLFVTSQTTTSEFVWIEIGVVVLIFLLLFFVMKSYLTPLRSIVTIVMTVVWTLGLTFLLFDRLLGIPVTWIVPIFLFVVCLGLGMDYDILLTTRIRENVMKGKSNDEAITYAVERSGAIITICGFIMAGAFSTLMFSSAPMIQEFGFALGFAILVDALFVRTYVVPAAMHLLGDWNWTGPKFMHKRDS